MTGESFGMFVVWTYLIGIVVAVSVIRVRSGAGFWHRLRILGPGGFGIVWFITSLVASMFWPVTLAVWAARGRPEPRVVFNDKATERQRRQAAGG